MQGSGDSTIENSCLVFTVSEDEWDTKEDTGKSMKNALYILQYAKRILSGRSNVEQ